MKACSMCGAEKPHEEFYKSKAAKGGRFSLCKLCHCTQKSEYYQANKEAIKTKISLYRGTHKAKIAAQRKATRSTAEGRKKESARCAKRNASKLKRTPLWADLAAIRKFYVKRPEGYHVDHVYPLRGESVSGLHVLDNLQYLTSIKNAQKSNGYRL